MTANPAAGPLTPRLEPLAAPTTIPPTIPAIIPENKGAPEAKAIPRHNGTATKNTTILAGKSFLISLNKFFDSIVCVFNDLGKDSINIFNNSITIFYSLRFFFLLLSGNHENFMISGQPLNIN